jgi:hypothetical protein
MQVIHLVNSAQELAYASFGWDVFYKSGAAIPGTSNRDSLHLVERSLIPRTVIELGGVRTFMRSHNGLDVVQSATGFRIAEPDFHRLERTSFAWRTISPSLERVTRL